VTAPAISIPEELDETFQRLESAGHKSWLIGDGLRAMLRGDRPTSYETITTATATEIVALVSRAIPTGRNGSVLTVPTRIGPLDLHVARDDANSCDTPLAQLAAREFSILTPALCTQSATWHDPWDGLADLAAGRLRRVDDARPTSAVFGIRAARLVAELDLEADANILDACRRSAEGVRKVRPPLLRRELKRLLLAEHCGRGLEFMRETGIEAALVEGVRSEASRLVPALPQELPIRMTAWLQGTRARSVLRRGRFGFNFSQAIFELLEHHPIDQVASPSNRPAVSRLLQHVGEQDLALLVRLRETEIDLMATLPGSADTAARKADATAARESLDAMKHALAKARVFRERGRIRSGLALSGNEVIEILACEAGPAVGRALDFLTDVVSEHPDDNTPEALRAHLMAWSPE